MSLRFHLFGTMCGGKTTIINRLKEKVPDLESWDIKDNFYIPREIIVNGRMDWDLYHFQKDEVSTDLIDFIRENEDVPIILESSGFNRTINMAIKGEGFIPIYLKVPTREEIARRAEMRDPQTYPALNIREKFIQHMEKVKKHLPQPLTEEEAYNEILKRIQEDRNK